MNRQQERKWGRLSSGSKITLKILIIYNPVQNDDRMIIPFDKENFIYISHIMQKKCNFFVLYLSLQFRSHITMKPNGTLLNTHVLTTFIY